MATIKVNVGDSVRLFNGTEGIIGKIDKCIFQFSLKDQYIIWFHLRDIDYLNNVRIDNDSLTF